MRYRDTFLSAVSATWNNKWLWLLSLLTLTPITISNEWKLGSNVIAALKKPDEYFFLISSLASGISEEGITLGSFLKALISSPGAAFSFVLAILFLVLILLFIAWVVINAQSIIIISLGDYRKMPFSLGKKLSVTTQYWKTALLINILLLSAKLLFISYLLLIEASANTILKAILLWSVALLGTFGLMLFSFTTRFAIFKVILERLSFYEALKEGFDLAKRRFMSCFEFSFLLFLITLLAILLMVVVMNILLPDDAFSLSLIIREGWGGLMLGGLTILFVILVSSLLLLFQYAAWLEWYNDEASAPHSYLMKLFYNLKMRLSRITYGKRSSFN